MTAATAACLLAGCAGLVAVDSFSARERLLRLRDASGDGVRAPGGDRRRDGPDPTPRRRKGWVARRWVARAGMVVVGALVLAGRTDLAVPAAVALLSAVLPARRRAAVADRQAALLARDLPRAADLMATCLEAGCAPADALRIVSGAVGGPVSEVLLPVAAAVRMGVDPAMAWTGAAEPGGRLDDPLRRLVRALARASATGAPLAATLRTLADDERERSRWTAEAAARRAGVRAVGPVAVCFLPAFLLLGVVPVVVGVATEVLGPLG